MVSYRRHSSSYGSRPIRRDSDPRIGWQSNQLQAPGQCFHVALHHPGLMGGMPVDDQEDLAAPAFDEVLQKGHKRFRIQLAGVSRRPKLAPGIDRADDVDALALAGSHHHRRLPLQSVGPAQRRIGLKPRLVQKENLGPHRLARCLSLG